MGNISTVDTVGLLHRETVVFAFPLSYLDPACGLRFELDLERAIIAQGVAMKWGKVWTMMAIRPHSSLTLPALVSALVLLLWKFNIKASRLVRHMQSYNLKNS